MASRKIEELTDDDWSFVEGLLGKEFSKQNEYDTAFKTKNKYSPNHSKTKKISKIMDAIRSEKSYRKATSIKW